MINQLFTSFSKWVFKDLKQDVPPSIHLHALINNIRTNSGLSPQEISTLVINCPCDSKDEILAKLLVMMHFHEDRIRELESKIKELTDK